MNFVEFQKNMRGAYVGGATGVLASGIVWILAGAIGTYSSSLTAMLALFFGGMFIFPLSILFSKLLSASGKHDSKNKLGHLALETLPTLFGGLLVAFYVAQFKLELFFPIMLLAIGARYFSFQTLYGLKEFWILGAALIFAGISCTVLSLPFISGAFIGGALELIFALIIFRKTRAVVSAAA